MANDDLERRFDEILADLTAGSNVHDFELRRAVAALGKAVIRLDSSSALLWKVNIGLTVVMLFVAILQLLRVH
jgi:hypothetical protein